MTEESAPATNQGFPRKERVSVLLLTATVVLTLHYYLGRPDVIGVFSESRGWSEMTLGALSPFWHFAVSLVLLAIVPLSVGRFALGMSLSEMGLGFGNWREGLKWLALGIPLAVLAGWIGGQDPIMRAVYPLDPSIAGQPARFAGYAVTGFLYYGSWEVLFRGVLMFGLLKSVSAWSANSAQTGFSVIAHFGRGLMETLSALPGGLVFGFVSMRLKSIWYIAIIHWVLGMSTEWFAGLP